MTNRKFDFVRCVVEPLCWGLSIGVGYGVIAIAFHIGAYFAS
jgi:hypothetical protein